MNKQQAIEVLETIQEFYPKMDMSKKQVRMLLPELLKMDYDGVMRNLSAHIVSNPFPPKFVDIAAYPKEMNKHIDQMRAWKEASSKITEESKRKYQEKIKKALVNHHAN